MARGSTPIVSTSGRCLTFRTERKLETALARGVGQPCFWNRRPGRGSSGHTGRGCEFTLPVICGHWRMTAFWN